MNPYLKNTILILSIVLIVWIGACKKEKTSTAVAYNEFRDSIAGHYNCVEHYYRYYFLLDTMSPPHGAWHLHDSILGPATVIISKSPSDDSSLIVNGATFSFSSSNDIQTGYYAHGFNAYDYFYFFKGNDSIWFNSLTDANIDTGISYYYYTGHKQ